MIVAESINWTMVIVSGIASVPAIVTAVLTWDTRKHAQENTRRLETPSGPTVGEQVEKAHALAALNTGYLQRVLDHVGADRPDAQEALSRADAEVSQLINGEPKDEPKRGSRRRSS